MRCHVGLRVFIEASPKNKLGHGYIASKRVKAHRCHPRGAKTESGYLVDIDKPLLSQNGTIQATLIFVVRRFIFPARNLIGEFRITKVR